MKRTLLFVIACIIGVGISGCMMDHHEGMTYQYARSLGLSSIRTYAIDSGAQLCGGYATVAWSNGANRGGILCIKNGNAIPLQN